MMLLKRGDKVRIGEVPFCEAVGEDRLQGSYHASYAEALGSLVSSMNPPLSRLRHGAEQEGIYTTARTRNATATRLQSSAARGAQLQQARMERRGV